MSKTVHSVKLIPYDSVNLNSLAYAPGELVYDYTALTVRLMDGVNLGGHSLLRADFSNASTTATLTVKSIIATTGLSGNLTGNVTGNVTGNLTGNVTGNLTGNVTGNVTGSSGSTTGNAATATKLANSVTINGVAFDGSTNITTHVAGTGISISGTTITNNGLLTLTGTAGSGSVNTGNGTLTFSSGNGVSVTASGSSLTVNTSQDLRTTATPTFTNLKIGTTPIRSLALALAAAMS